MTEKICANCGSQLLEDATFCTTCGNKIPDLAKVNNVTVLNSDDENTNETLVEESVCDNTKEVVNTCPKCSEVVFDGEQYCIKCGAKIKVDLETQSEATIENMESKERLLRLQSDVSFFYKNNKILNLVSKCASFLIFLYPVYSILGRIDFFDTFLDFLVRSSIDDVIYYGFLASIVYLFSQKHYLSIIIAFSLRILVSVIFIFQGGVVTATFCNFAFRIWLIVVVWRLFSQTEQYNVIKSKFTNQQHTCSKCGSKVKHQNAFCPNCGNKM